jgi:serine/threonine-protein kinase
MSVEDATSTLQELGFVVIGTGESSHPTIEPGLVAATDPAAGEPVSPGSEVTLLVSTGPRLLPVPPFAGMTEADAVAAIEAAPFALADPVIRQFDAAIAEGIVIDALAGDGSSLTGVAEYGEQQPVTLVVSAGPLPDFAGLTVEQAVAKLGELGLQQGATVEGDFHDTVPQGAVLRIQAEDPAAAIRVGSFVDIVTSKGVELIEVPDVLGMPWSEAKGILESAGFSLIYNGVADLLPGAFIVADLTPDELTMQPKGSDVRISFSS